ncbi:MAG TPA: hypothetical protein VF771_12670 [Longimicrobiaceae bacterium]
MGSTPGPWPARIVVVVVISISPFVISARQPLGSMPQPWAARIVVTVFISISSVQVCARPSGSIIAPWLARTRVAVVIAGVSPVLGKVLSCRWLDAAAGGGVPALGRVVDGAGDGVRQA